MDDIDTIHLERSLEYGEGHGVADRNLFTSNLMELARSTLLLREALSSLAWEQVAQHVSVCENRFTFLSKEKYEENTFVSYLREIGLVRSELRHRECVMCLSSALVVGGPIGDIGSLNVEVIDVEGLDAALLVARARITDETNSVNNVNKMNNATNVGLGLGLDMIEDNVSVENSVNGLSTDESTTTKSRDKRGDAQFDGSILSSLLVRLFRLASCVRRLRASMRAQTFDIAETVLLEIENDENILNINVLTDIDETLLRPPSITSYTNAATEETESDGIDNVNIGMIAFRELRACRLELNDMSMCFGLRRALREGKYSSERASIANGAL